MKKTWIVSPSVTMLVFVIFSFGFSMPSKKQLQYTGTKKGFAVVELFTSEGCSSCPPAEEVVAALAKDYPANVFVLGFHVDYWDYLGWKDEFSSADYSKRQQQYAAAFDLNSIYTPQVVVNGKTQFTGSDKSRLYSATAKELTNDNTGIIEMSAATGHTNEVLITYKTNAGSKSVVCIALVQLQTSSTVKRGENKGMLLHHINVVRNFKTMNNNTGSTSIALPAGLTAKECKTVVFIQNKNDMHITAAAEAEIH